jgi:hypothetical protein
MPDRTNQVNWRPRMAAAVLIVLIALLGEFLYQIGGDE